MEVQALQKKLQNRLNNIQHAAMDTSDNEPLDERVGGEIADNGEEEEIDEATAEISNGEEEENNEATAENSNGEEENNEGTANLVRNRVSNDNLVWKDTERMFRSAVRMDVKKAPTSSTEISSNCLTMPVLENLSRIKEKGCKYTLSIIGIVDMAHRTTSPSPIFIVLSILMKTLRLYRCATLAYTSTSRYMSVSVYSTYQSVSCMIFTMTSCAMRSRTDLNAVVQLRPQQVDLSENPTPAQREAATRAALPEAFKITLKKIECKKFSNTKKIKECAQISRIRKELRKDREAYDSTPEKGRRFYLESRIQLADAVPPSSTPQQPSLHSHGPALQHTTPAADSRTPAAESNAAAEEKSIIYIQNEVDEEYLNNMDLSEESEEEMTEEKKIGTRIMRMKIIATNIITHNCSMLCYHEIGTIAGLGDVFPIATCIVRCTLESERSMRSSVNKTRIFFLKSKKNALWSLSAPCDLRSIRLEFFFQKARKQHEIVTIADLGDVFPVTTCIVRRTSESEHTTRSASIIEYGLLCHQTNWLLSKTHLQRVEKQSTGIFTLASALSQLVNRANNLLIWFNNLKKQWSTARVTSATLGPRLFSLNIVTFLYMCTELNSTFYTIIFMWRRATWRPSRKLEKSKVGKGFCVHETEPRAMASCHNYPVRHLMERLRHVLTDLEKHLSESIVFYKSFGVTVKGCQSLCIGYIRIRGEAVPSAPGGDRAENTRRDYTVAPRCVEYPYLKKTLSDRGKFLYLFTYLTVSRAWHEFLYSARLFAIEEIRLCWRT
ncbi:unnamed protein product [Trichogramma brassicae]|uniref:Uncharacterized protein n=1 Tax=Trichogramma brassicae TaxID=86971 RepID=A0A6H5IFB3_9HYME|nr:unnamed protein product [Trichogramma brassicae]